MLIDGHSLIFRMYYAFLRHPMINSKGVDVSILFGFMKYLLELIEKEKPTHMAVCFDPPGKTFRHEMFPEYKGTRQATPELVIEALQPLTELCEAYGLPVLMKPGLEGDDVLGALAVRSAAEGMTVYMVTPDKDFGQLIGPGIYQFKPGKSGADNEILGAAELCAKLGISTPSQVIDMLAICGDAADNVPGVNGVGEVGAGKLISKYGTLENIYAHLDELTPRQTELFRAAQDHIALSKQLVTIKTDITLDITQDDMKVPQTHGARIFELFDQYEFSSLRRHLVLAEGQVLAQAKPRRELKWDELGPEDFMAKVSGLTRVAMYLDYEGDGLNAEVLSLTMAAACDNKYLTSKGMPADFAALLADAAVSKTGYNLKIAVNLLAGAGVNLAGRLEDLELMHYLINPEKSHKLEILARAYLDVNLQEEEEPAPAESLSLFDIVDDTPVASRSRSREALCCALLFDTLDKELRDLEMEKLFYDIEEPLQRVLSSMERAGVMVEMASLGEFAAQLRDELVEIEARVREMAGEPDLNVASPKQVGAVLFEKLRIDPKMKPRKDARSAYPTDEETLMNYADANPIIGEILDYRAVSKLLNTYIEPFGTWISPADGRVHTTFNQALTATGRLSSSRPNLQNIPIRTDRGKLIRKAFVASSPDSYIVSADYSQIELRLMAHFCGDEHMLHAFRNGQDVHAATAAKIFKVPVEDVTSDMRRKAKTANFGILYGISAFGLAQRLRIPRVAAKKLIEDYFEGFPSIQQWIDKAKADALRDGYVQTLFGRRRYVPDIASRNATARALAERNAVNAPIQGTAADIIKIAMIRVDETIRNAGLKSRMVLQIHDELLFEVPADELETLMEIVRTNMENVVELKVPLTVECSYGKNWLEAH